MRAGAGVPAIALLLLAGLALRLIIAYVLFPGSGFTTDISSFTSWAMTLARYGPPGFYANAGFADYTPGYLYILWLVGLAGRAVATLTGTDQATVTGQLIKLPAILLDLAVAYVLYRTVCAWNGRLDEPPAGGANTRSADARRVRLLALGVAALYLFNPVPWYDSALWGQVDALGALVVLGAVLALVGGWSESAAALTALAALVKPQFGLVLAPIVGVVLLRRHLFIPGSGPRPGIRRERLAGWFVEEQGPWRLVSCVAAGLAVLFVVIVPFRLDIVGLLRLVLTTAGEYHYLTVNAYNPWALIADPGGASLAHAGTWSDDLVPLLGPLPGFAVGAILLLAGIALGVLQVAWRDDRRSILLATAFLSLAFFVLPTRVHERYLFPIFVFLPLLAMTSRRWLVATVVLAAASFMNLHGVLTLPLYATPNIANLLGGPAFRSEAGVAISALGHVGVFLLALAALDPVRRLFGRWRSAPEPQPALPEPQPALPEPQPALPQPALSQPGVVGQGAAGGAFVGDAAGSPGAAAIAPAAEWMDRPPTRWGSEMLRGLMGRGSIRADRSRQLHGEDGGRIDRLDLLVMALLVVAAMTVRIVGLAQPYGMYFDEVYHARTATEFLQDWRYGMPHAIYEFTHPHLAKYLMAVGLVAFGDDRVTGTSSLGVPVRATAIEPRWSDAGASSGRDGDRLYVATGSDVVAYDLQGRGVVARIAVPGATAVAVDSVQHVLYAAAADGTIWSLPTSRLDALRSTSGGVADIQPTKLAGSGAGAPVQRLVASATGGSLLAVTTTGQLVSIGASITPGSVLGRTAASQQAGTGPVLGVVPLDPVTGVTVDLTKSYDPAKLGALTTALGVTIGPIFDLPAAVSRWQDAVAADTATVLRDESVRVPTVAENAALAAARQALAADQQQLATARANLRPVVVAAFLDAAQQANVQGALQGLGDAASLDTSPVFAVSAGTSVRFLDAVTLDPVFSVNLGGTAGGMTFVESGIDEPTLYVASDRMLRTIQLPPGAQPILGSPVPMPGTVTDATWDAASNMVHALGRTPDGSSPTIYVVEPHGNAVYANANLPFTPVAWVFDQQPGNPSGDRQQILVFSGTGSVAAVDAGSHAFAWRLPGVIAGSLLVALLYLLARILFRRRSVGLFVAAFAMVDGMLFANSRIGMNDIYAALFIVAAYAVFAALALGRWRGRSALLAGLPLLGILLGLACASKWVGFYAVGGIGLLTLLRSGLGRVLALGAMAVLTGILGYYSITAAPDTTSPQLNVTFLLMMIALTLLLAAAIAVRSIHWTVEELRFAVLAPLALGVLAGAAGVGLGSRLHGGPLSQNMLLAGGFALVVVAFVAYAAPLVLARFGAGPLAPPPRLDEARVYADAPADPPAESWLVPGASLGLPWLWALACMTVVPLVVYVVVYIPWVALGNQFWTGFPAGNHGQTLWDLTVSMFNYHNDLRVAHPASSPWWAWPFDLKPVWWYQGSLANDTGASIYDAGNLVLFWLSVTAVPWTAWQAWRRRSLALGIVVMAFASQWLPWVWVDRATFQYHVLTTLPFTFLALAYFVAELWHGPARRTWALARATAAMAILGPAILWLVKGPLCVFAGTAAVDQASQVCGAVANPVIVTQRVAAAAIVIVIGALGVGWLWWTVRGASAADGGGAARLRALAPAVAAGVIVLVALAVVQTIVPDVQFVSVPLGSGGPFVVAAIVGVLLCGPAWLVLRARDPRRFALGIVGAAALWFVVWYPNIAALPLPGSFVNMYQGLLPTWIYDFQFTVNMTPAAHPKLITAESISLIVAVVIGSLAVMYAARAWSLEWAVRRAERDRGAAESAGETGPATT